MVVGQALPDELLARVRHHRLRGELHLSGVQDRLVSHDCHLRFVVAERLHAKEKLVEDHAHAPNVNLAGDLRIPQVKALRRLIPIGTDALTCQFYFILSLLEGLAEAEVCNFHFPIVKNDILRLQVVVNDPLLLIVQVFYSTQDLGNNELSLFLSDLFILLEIIVEVGSRAKLKDRAEGIVIDFDCVVVFDDSPMLELFVNLILSQGVLDVVVLYLVRPAIVEVVNFAGHFSAEL